MTYPLPRAPLPGPPKGWRPKKSLRLERDAALIALGLDPTRTHFDHRPPVQQRVFVPELNDTIPSCYDPSTLVPVGDARHREVTAKVDIPEIARTKRLSAEQAAFRKTMETPREERPVKKSKIQSRGFAPGKRKWGR